MWIFTDIADLFDKTRKDNEKWIDSELQPWVATTLYDDSPWYRNVGVWTASGTLYALNKFTTTVAAGFVDVLRLGDGVQEGGWGYGKDALRLLMVIGPALRGARYVIAGIQELDVGTTAFRQARAAMSAEDALKAVPWVRNCGWVAAARLLRLTGTGPLTKLSDVARAAGMDIEETGGLKSVTQLDAPMRFLGAATRIKAVQGMDGVADLASQNPNSSVMFGVRWVRDGKTIGHVLVATRRLFGTGIRILDRSGKAVDSLADLASSYRGIENATVDTAALLVDNTMTVQSLETVPTLGNIVSQVASGHSREPDSGAAGTTSTPPPAAKAAAASGGGGAKSTSASTVTPGTQSVSSTTVCMQANSDVGVTCTTTQTKTYKVGRGEGLMAISQRVYGDASKWKLIAAANGIKPPKYVILEGQVLLIP